MLKWIVALLVLALWPTLSTGQPPKSGGCVRPGGCPDPIIKPNGVCVCPEKSATADATISMKDENSLILMGKNKGKAVEWTVNVDYSTKIQKAGKDATIEDLKPGDSVSIDFRTRGGTSVAEFIKVW
jgi:hypothetical protein